MGLCKVESRIAAVERERRNVITPQTCFIGMLSIIFCRQRTSSSAIIKDASSRARARAVYYFNSSLSPDGSTGTRRSIVRDSEASLDFLVIEGEYILRGSQTGDGNR